MATIVETGETLQNLLGQPQHRRRRSPPSGYLRRGASTAFESLGDRRALSIQVHPNKAGGGMGKEEHLRSASQNCGTTKIPTGKQVGYALRTVTALSRFRPPAEEIRAWLRRFDPLRSSDFFSYLDEEGDEDGRIRRFFPKLYWKKDLGSSWMSCFFPWKIFAGSADQSFCGKESLNTIEHFILRSRPVGRSSRTWFIRIS